MGEHSSSSTGWKRTRGLILKALALVGGALLYKRFSKCTTRWDHARVVAESLCGEKFTQDQASRDPVNYFNLRMHACSASTMVDGTRVLYLEQAFWRTPEKPFRQRFYTIKPCSKEMKCDVEVSSYAVKDPEVYKEFCDRPEDQRSHAEEVIEDVGEHLTTMHLSRCARGKCCLYEGSTPPGGFPNLWNGATHFTSEITVLKNDEIHMWDRGYDEEENQVWGVKDGPYEFRPAPLSRHSEMFSYLNFPSCLLMDKNTESLSHSNN